MKKLSFFYSICFSLFLIFSCDSPIAELQPEMLDDSKHKSAPIKSSKVTGELQVAWKGKGGSGMVEDKLVFVSFDAQEALTKINVVGQAKGSFIFSVFKSDLTPEREIVAEVMEVGFSDPETGKGWFFAEVVSDTKCGSSDDSGCSDSDHTDGGCSHDDSTHDGGCSHDTDTEHPDTGSGGGCSHDDTGTDTGCEHDDTGTEHDEGSGGKPDNKGGKGKQCRIGQFVVAKMHDKGSPGTNDGITWKWFKNLDGFSIDLEPKHLCKKTILEGNLTVHIAKQKS